MSQSPYASIGAEPLEPVAQRTSVLAIFALVVAIISIVPLFCVFPGSGALAVILGGAALLLISRERGRLSGTGLAATGIVLGLIVTVIQIVAVVMVTRGTQWWVQNMVSPSAAVLTHLEKGDLASARKAFAPSADAQISDEMLLGFVTSYKADLGAFKRTPTSILELVRGYMNVGPAIQGMPQGRNDVIPFPAEFEKGYGVLVIMIDQQAMNRSGGPNSGAFQLPVRNIGVLSPSGKQYWILDPVTLPSPPGSVIITPPGGGKIKIETDPPQSPLPQEDDETTTPEVEEPG